MSENRIGTSTRIFKLNVTTKTIQLCAKNPKRTGLLVVNNSSVVVYILSAQNQSASDGIPIAAGASYTNDTTTAELFIIAASGTQDVRVEVDSS